MQAATRKQIKAGHNPDHKVWREWQNEAGVAAFHLKIQQVEAERRKAEILAGG